MHTVSVIVLKMIQRALSSLNITVLPNFLFAALIICQKIHHLSPMVIMEELCGSKLGLVAAIAGKLTLRMRFELWCLLTLVHWRNVRKHFMLDALCLLSYRYWSSKAQKQPAHCYRTRWLAFIREVWSFDGCGCAGCLSSGISCCVFTKGRSCRHLGVTRWLFQDGGGRFLRHAGTYLPNRRHYVP